VIATPGKRGDSTVTGHGVRAVHAHTNSDSNTSPIFDVPLGSRAVSLSMSIPETVAGIRSSTPERW
jgi:hypothetical protein